MAVFFYGKEKGDAYGCPGRRLSVQGKDGAVPGLGPCPPPAQGREDVTGLARDRPCRAGREDMAGMAGRTTGAAGAGKAAATRRTRLPAPCGAAAMGICSKDSACLWREQAHRFYKGCFPCRIIAST